MRALVRDNLVEHRQILLDAEEMSTADFRDRVRDVVVEMAATGQTGMGFPTEFGGGGDIGASVAAFETLAFGDLSVLVKVGVQFGLFGGAILQLGTKRAPRRLPGRPRHRQGDGLLRDDRDRPRLQRPGAGDHCDVRRRDREFVITTPDDASRKDYIGNAAAHADAGGRLRAARGRWRGPGRARVRRAGPRRTGKVLPGVRIEDCGRKMGLNGVDNGRIWFDGVRVPRTSLLNQFADVTEAGDYASSIENPNRRFFTMLGTLVQGRVCVGGAGINAVEGRAHDRDQVRRPPPPVRGHRPRRGAADPRLRHAPAAAVPADRAHLRAPLRAGVRRRRTARRLHAASTGDEQSRRRLESSAAGTKALGTWHATRTIQECREACGGAGYLSQNRFAALKADTDVFTTFEGDNHVLLQLVAKGLLTDYSSEFEDMDQFGMVRFVAGLAVETVLERTSAHKLFQRIKDALPGGDQWDQEAGLLDPNYQRAMLRFREEHMLGGVARRLKRGIDDGMNPGEVFSRVQDHVIAAARAHVERMVLDSFVREDPRAARRRPEGRPQPALRPARA